MLGFIILLRLLFLIPILQGSEVVDEDLHNLKTLIPFSDTEAVLCLKESEKSSPAESTIIEERDCFSGDCETNGSLKKPRFNPSIIYDEIYIKRLFRLQDDFFPIYDYIYRVEPNLLQLKPRVERRKTPNDPPCTEAEYLQRLSGLELKQLKSWKDDGFSFECSDATLVLLKSYLKRETIAPIVLKHLAQFFPHVFAHDYGEDENIFAGISASSIDFIIDRFSSHKFTLRKYFEEACRNHKLPSHRNLRNLFNDSSSKENYRYFRDAVKGGRLDLAERCLWHSKNLDKIPWGERGVLRIIIEDLNSKVLFDAVRKRKDFSQIARFRDEANPQYPLVIAIYKEAFEFSMIEALFTAFPDAAWDSEESAVAAACSCNRMNVLDYLVTTLLSCQPPTPCFKNELKSCWERALRESNHEVITHFQNKSYDQLFLP